MQNKRQDRDCDAQWRLKTLCLILLVLCGLTLCSQRIIAQGTNIELLPPTGKLPVGRTSYHWIDAARQEPNAQGSSAKREVTVQIWYPADIEPGNNPAPYIPNLQAIQTKLGKDTLKREAGAAYDALFTVRTHVTADAAVRKSADNYPVLLLSHQLGGNALLYSMLAEDLASWGYIVVGVDHPYVALAVLSNDDKIIRHAADKWNNRGKSSEETLAFERKSNDLCAADLMFVLDQLGRLNTGTITSPFKGRLDLARVGAFGHSLGGRVAARTLQLDPRVRAAISLDGLTRKAHFDVKSDGSTLPQPFMVIRQPYKTPPDEALKRMQKTREQMIEENRQVRQEFFASVKAVSYDLSLNIPGIGHQSFCDAPLLESGSSEEKLVPHRRTLELTRQYIRAFFDRHVREEKTPLLEAGADSPKEIELTRYQFRKP